MWRKEGFVRKDVYLERIKAGDIELDKKRDDYDKDHGYTDKAFSVRVYVCLFAYIYAVYAYVYKCMHTYTSVCIRIHAL